MRFQSYRFHLRDIEIEFLGGNLQQGSGAALTQFDETDKDGCGVIGVDSQPGVELLHVGLVGAIGVGNIVRCLRLRFASDGEAHQHRATGFQKIAAREGIHFWVHF